MMKLNVALSQVSNLGFDTAPIIYFIEANPNYDPLVTDIFERVSQGQLFAFTSVVTLTEVLVQPISKSNRTLEQQYRQLLLFSPNFFTNSITPEIASRAAGLRAKYRLRTPDAFQIAAALESGCEAFLCNDKGLRRVTEINVLILDEIEL